MGEKKHSTKQGGSNSYLVEWSDGSDVTEHKCSREPEQNLTRCPQLVKGWFELGLTKHKDRLKDAKQIGIMSLQLLARKLSATESLVVTDLSQSEYCYMSMIDRILQEQILLIWASQPCNTISPAGAVNQEKGYHHCGYSQPQRPPRHDDSECARETKKHDGMTSKVVKALSHSIAHRGTQAALENPKYGTGRLLFMNEPRWKALTEKHTIDYCAIAL